jgi:hypothetical protein
LTELAGQVATSGAEGQDRRSGQEMVERFLLDRVDAKAAGAAIGGQYNLLPVAGAHEAQAALAIVKPAEAWAEITLKTAVVRPMPITARNTFDAVALFTDQWGLSHIKTASQSA